MDQVSNTSSKHYGIGTTTTNPGSKAPLIVTRQSYPRVDRLDSEILAMERFVRLAKELRNQALPIYTLPPEIILEIFLYVRDAFVYQPFEWLSASSHTCRRFRSIALSSRALWSQVGDIGHSPELIKTLLERSGNHPTRIHLNFGASLEKDRVQKLALDFEVSRAKTLDVAVTSFCRQSDGESLVWLLGAPMPFLRRLDINSPYNRTRPWPSPVHIPPALESLSARHCAFVWQSPVYDNLVELTLTHLIGMSCAPSVAECQDLFSRMHRLETLTIDRFSLRDYPKKNCIKLPQRLKCFEIIDAVALKSETVIFAPNPTLSKLTVCGHHSIFDPRRRPSSIADFVQHWCGMWNGHAQIFMKVSLLVQNDRRSLHEVDIFSSKLATENIPAPLKASSHFTYNLAVPSGFRVDRSLARVCSVVDSFRLDVRGYGADDATYETWRTMLRGLNGLKSLALTVDSLSTILPCLVGAPDSLPQLDVLEVIDGQKLVEELDEANHCHITWLSRWLEERTKQGFTGPRRLILPPLLEDELLGRLPNRTL